MNSADLDGKLCIMYVGSIDLTIISAHWRAYGHPQLVSLGRITLDKGVSGLVKGVLLHQMHIQIAGSKQNGEAD